MKKSGHDFERKQKEVYWRVWRKEGEGGNGVTVSILRMKESKGKRKTKPNVGLVVMLWLPGLV